MLFKLFFLNEKSDILQHFRLYIFCSNPHAADVLGFLTFLINCFPNGKIPYGHKGINSSAKHLLCLCRLHHVEPGIFGSVLCLSPSYPQNISFSWRTFGKSSLHCFKPFPTRILLLQIDVKLFRLEKNKVVNICVPTKTLHWNCKCGTRQIPTAWSTLSF